MVCPTGNSNSSWSDFTKSVNKPEFPKWKFEHRNTEVADPKMGELEGKICCTGQLLSPVAAVDARGGYIELRVIPSLVQLPLVQPSVT